MASPVNAQLFGIGRSSCYTGASVLNDRFISVTAGAKATDVVVTSPELTLADVNLLFAGAATGARLNIGIVGRDGNFVHGAYLGMGTVSSGQAVPAQKRTFHNLEPLTTYVARIFLDEVKGPVEEPECFKRQIQGTVYRTICHKPDLARQCFATNRAQ